MASISGSLLNLTAAGIVPRLVDLVGNSVPRLFDYLDFRVLVRQTAGSNELPFLLMLALFQDLFGRHTPIVPGSGTVALPPPQLVMTLLSSVTAPFRAKALPQLMLAPVFRVMLVSARIFPSNEVVVPRVAELPTTQYTASFVPRFSVRTDEADAVVRVLPIWKMMAVLLRFWKSSVRDPVNPADDVNLKTPGVSVNPPRS